MSYRIYTICRNVDTDTSRLFLSCRYTRTQPYILQMLWRERTLSSVKMRCCGIFWRDMTYFVMNFCVIFMYMWSWIWIQVRWWRLSTTVCARLTYVQYGFLIVDIISYREVTHPDCVWFFRSAEMPSLFLNFSQSCCDFCIVDIFLPPPERLDNNLSKFVAPFAAFGAAEAWCMSDRIRLRYVWWYDSSLFCRHYILQ